VVMRLAEVVACAPEVVEAGATSPDVKSKAGEAGRGLVLRNSIKSHAVAIALSCALGEGGRVMKGCTLATGDAGDADGRTGFTSRAKGSLAATESGDTETPETGKGDGLLWQNMVVI
jgi:hypothetical protein